MDMRSKERTDEMPSVETPEDVAVLYSWANLHGAKYRDFSASRREYRAQLRHRAAEQAREQELRAQAHAETAASVADKAALQAGEAATLNQAKDTEYSHQQVLHEAEKSARVAAAERIEAARRAEAAAVADAVARREEREIAEANASARRQAAQYADSDVRRRQTGQQDLQAALPGTISDPYTPQPQAQLRPAAAAQPIPPAEASSDPPSDRYHAAPSSPSREPEHLAPPTARTEEADEIEYAPAHQPAPATTPLPITEPARRPQGYRPDDASGVRQIYRGPEFETPRPVVGGGPARQLIPVGDRPPVQPSTPHASARSGQQRASAWADGVASNPVQYQSAPGLAPRRVPAPLTSAHAPSEAGGTRSRSVSPFSQPSPDENLQDPTPRRRRQDAPGYKQEHPSDANPSRRKEDAAHRAAQLVASPADRRSPTGEPAPSPAATPESSGPAWLYASVPQTEQKSAPVPAQSSVADTLQHSRERVAARWYALKGVFEQPGQEQPEPAPVRQKETRTPILAVFSLAGGVGKTSLVATLGRSLSSLGEKVLLTDTTSHGLLPFYFGASELRQGTVRTFSPPSGSTDAPIYLVSYDVEEKSSDEAAQDALVDEITGSSRGTHRVLLDLNVSSGWIVRRMARLSPTILVPVAPDMNSVISLGAVEKFFNGVVGPEGRPLKLFYLLNQFDASLPLHLDIREVLRRQLGDRLLPFVIRRAPAVGEALAEGMTIVDYAPDAPVAEDYLNAASWLRTVAAPATAGFRNVRWSER